MKLRTNFIFWLCCFYVVGYGALFTLAGYAVSAFVLAGLLFGFGLVVFLDWFTTGYAAFRSGGRQGEAILAFSICVVATYAIYTRIWAVARLSLGSPEWMDTSPIGQFAAVLLLMFFTGIVLATGAKDSELPKRRLVQYGIALFAAGLFTGVAVALAFSPDVMKGVNDRTISPSGNNLPQLVCPGQKQLVHAYCRMPPGEKLAR